MIDVNMLDDMKHKMIAAGGVPHRLLVSNELFNSNAKTLSGWCVAHRIELEVHRHLAESAAVLRPL